MSPGPDLTGLTPETVGNQEKFLKFSHNPQKIHIFAAP